MTSIEGYLKMKSNLTAETLRRYLIYDPETGVFTWRISVSATAQAGSIAGAVKGPYILIGLNSKIYYAHRLAFLYMEGAMPPRVDHKNGWSNCWSNLRVCTQQQNMYNTKLSVTNTSGTKGITKNKRSNKWQCQISIKGKRTYKFFKEQELPEAINWITDMRIKLHGEFANHGL